MLQAELDLLVMKAQQGNEGALLVLFQHYQPGLIQFAYGLLREQASAQDAVQNAWLKILNKLPSLSHPEVFKSWIYRAVRWSATDILRQRQLQRQRQSEQVPEELAQASEQTNDTLHSALQGLPADEYQAIHLFYFSQLTVVEIALVQEVPVGTVKTRLFRAKAKLKVTLENQHEY